MPARLPSAWAAIAARLPGNSGATAGPETAITAAMKPIAALMPGAAPVPPLGKVQRHTVALCE